METSSETKWTVLGKKLPKSEIVYFTQIVVLFTVIAISLYNLTSNTESRELWISLMSSSLGYILPSPKIKKHVLPEVAQ